tara:strand:+ start:132 stop:947 length:816 start_codon:yes stop_codon:yes gene_type:complete
MPEPFKKSSMLNKKLMKEARGRGDPERIRGLLSCGASLWDDVSGRKSCPPRTTYPSDALSGLDYALAAGNSAAALVFLEAAGCDVPWRFPTAASCGGIVPTCVAGHETFVMANAGTCYLMAYHKGGGGDANMTQMRTMAIVIKILLRCRYREAFEHRVRNVVFPTFKLHRDIVATCCVDSTFEMAQWLRDESLAAQLYLAGFRQRNYATARQRKFVHRAVIRHALRRRVATRRIALYWQELAVRRQYAKPALETFEADMEKPVFTEGRLGA